MKFPEFIAAQHSFPFFLTLKITPNAPKTEMGDFVPERELWKMKVRAVPEKGKANAEIERFFRKEFGFFVTLLSGKTDRTKLIKISK